MPWRANAGIEILKSRSATASTSLGIQSQIQGIDCPFLAVTDYMRLVPDQGAPLDSGGDHPGNRWVRA